MSVQYHLIITSQLYANVFDNNKIIQLIYVQFNI